MTAPRIVRALAAAKRKLDAADCRDMNAAISAQWDLVGAAEKAGG